MTTPEPLPMWTIYRGVSDVDALYAVRLWHVTAGAAVAAGPAAPADSLHQARALLPAHADVRLGPMLGDDPCIVETWI